MNETTVEALRREIERLRGSGGGDGLVAAILEHSPHGIVVCDANGQFVLRNAAADRIYGGPASAADRDGWSAYRTFRPDGSPYPPDEWPIARALRDGTTVEAEEIQIQRADGRHRVVVGSAAPIRGPDGRIESALAVFVDVTRLRELESALVAAEVRSLREMEVLYRLADAANRATTADDVYEPALDAIGAGLGVERASILLFDDRGVMRFRAWRGLSDRYRAAVDGHSPWSRDEPDARPIVVPDVRADRELRSYGDLFEAEGIRALAFIPLVHQGELLGKFMVYSPAPRTIDGHELQFAVSIASHISQAVARARLYASAEAANRAKDEFISLLGHELRNPLAPIATALHLMRMRDDRTFARERTVIERQVGHLRRLVDDLLDVARIARGVVELRKEVVEVAQVVARAVEMAAPLLEEKGHRLEVDVAPDLLVRADDARLAQVVGNLVHNAAKFTPRGGSIRVAASEAHEEIEIVVEDDGQGIGPELLAVIFEPFRQGRRADAGLGGLGLGLSIVRSLVQLHGGEVSAHSDGPGRGARFVVRLPSGEGLTGSDHAVPMVTPAGVARRVLVVDDNTDAAELLADALAAAGHDVRCAGDGPTALREAAAFRPEVALLDLGLPVMDGYELAERLAAMPELHGVRLLAVTGYGQAADRQRALAGGFAEHFTKPVDVADLLERISA